MLKVQLYTIKGSKVGEVVLPKDAFEGKINMDLLSQANHVYEERSHIGLRNTKTRSEINRTTKKVYKQKGTGGARHGSRRANVFVGGGIVFGPRALRRVLEMSKSLKDAAKISAFSAKAKVGEIIAIKGLSEVKKTKEFGEFVKKLGQELKSKRFTFVLSEGSKGAFRFLKNIENVSFVLYQNINAFDIITAGELVLDEAIFNKKEEKSKEKKEKGTIKEVKKMVRKDQKKKTK